MPYGIDICHFVKQLVWWANLFINAIDLAALFTLWQGVPLTKMFNWVQDMDR